MGKVRGKTAPRGKRHTMRKIFIVFLFASALLLPGCLLQDNYFRESVRGDPVYIDLGLAGSCPTGDCICMVCGVNIPEDPYNKFYPVSYASQLCSFKRCEQQDYLEYIKPPAEGQDRLNFFMVGQGGFGEFNKANPYCNNSLRMPVKWLDSRDGLGEYPLPDADRATCFMDKGSMPVYLLYSRGQAVSVERAREIAALFSGRGPVIIASEFEFNSSNPEIAANVTAQVKAMKQACPNCLIALAPLMGDNSTAFRKVVSDSGDSIDLFAFGLNSRDFSTCNPAKVYYAGMWYSKYLMFNYRKPSVWAYVLFDRDYSTDRSCVWDDSALSKAYAGFYTYAPGMAASGVIGASLYSLYGIGPLYCNNCSLFSDSGSPVLPVQPAWFSNCQESFATRSVLPLAYSNAQGTTCLFGPRLYSYTGYSYYTDESAPVQPASSAPTFYSCDSCLVTKRPVSINIRPTIFSDDRICTDHPVLDVYADIRDIDPAYLRANTWHESGFNRCSVPSSTAACGRVTQITSITDPDSGCGEEDPDWRGSSTYTVSTGHVCDVGLIPTFATPEDTWDEITWTSTGEGDLELARACAGDEKFNPFNTRHNVCLGTFEIKEHLESAKRIVEDNEGRLGLTAIRGQYGEEEYRNAKGLVTLYITRTYFIGNVWASYGERWMDAFSEYSRINRAYCSANPDGHVCCSGSSLNPCCGSVDFINFASSEQCNDLAGIRISSAHEQGVKNIPVVLSKYLGVIEKCGICNSGIWEENIEEWYAGTEAVSIYS